MENPPNTIHLDQFLKRCSAITGGQAKLLIQSGEILVNDEIETRRRRQLIEGDEVQLGEDIFVVAFESQQANHSLDDKSASANSIETFACIDIGANLTHKSFQRDLEHVVEDALAVSVNTIILTGACERSSQQAVKLSEKYPEIFLSTAGVHPHDAKSFDDTVQQSIEALLENPRVVAVGECGLDFNRDFSPREDQRRCFEAQLKLAAKIQKPLFLHERDAHDEFLGFMTQYRDSINRGVVHCFTGSEAAMKAYLDLDLHIGITGWICDERRGTHLRELVKQVPVERLMIETDSPYLAPRDIRPKIQRNEPKYLPHILRHIALCRNEDPVKLAEQVLETTNSFFSIT